MAQNYCERVIKINGRTACVSHRSQKGVASASGAEMQPQSATIGGPDDIGMANAREVRMHRKLDRLESPPIVSTMGSEFSPAADLFLEGQ